MKWHRIRSVFLQEHFVSKRSLEVTMDLVFFSLFAVLVFGYISLFLAGQTSSEAAQVVILGLLLWEIIRLTQYTVSISTLWNVWSRNLTNVFVAPVSIAEYMGAHMLSAAVKTLAIFCVMSVVTALAFDFNILSIGLVNLAIIFINLVIFAWSVGLVLLGLIFRFGTRIQALAWGTIFLFQPMSAAFFPVTVLPLALRVIAYCLPATYFFELGRFGLTHSGTDWKLVTVGSILNIVYFVFAVFLFNSLFNKSKETGQFARNDA